VTDRIFLKGLLVHAHHGLLSHESEVGQRFVIDLDMAVDLTRAAASDHLARYRVLCRCCRCHRLDLQGAQLQSAGGGRRGDSGSHSGGFPRRFPPSRVTVHKPHAPIAAIFDDVGVVLTRRRGA
jgi:dihydroneopterin aldolase